MAKLPRVNQTSWKPKEIEAMKEYVADNHYDNLPDDEAWEIVHAHINKQTKELPFTYLLPIYVAMRKEELGSK